MSLDVKVSSSNLGKNVIFRDDTLKLYSIERRLFVMTHFTLCAVSLFRFVDDVHFTSPERNPSILTPFLTILNVLMALVSFSVRAIRVRE